MATDGPIEMVPFLDVTTGRLVQIPATELRGDAVQVQLQGVRGPVWTVPADLKTAESRHPLFTHDTQALIAHIRTVFAEHRPATFEEWQDGFRRESDPASEIALWLHAARVYKAFADAESWAKRRAELFRCLVSCMTTSYEGFWSAFELRSLSESEVRQVVHRFYHKS